MLGAAAELGAIGEVANILSTWGLRQTSAVTGETILGCVTCFRSLLTLLLLGSRIGVRTAVACCIAFGATLSGALLTRSQPHAATLSAPSTFAGPMTLVVAAFHYALFRVRIQAHLQRGGFDPLQLASARIVSMGLIGTVLVGADTLGGGPSAANVLGIAAITREQWVCICASCCLSGLGGSILHFRAQSIVPAANAQPFFALTPMFAALWSWVILDETVPVSLLLTALLMVSAAVLASTDQSAKTAMRDQHAEKQEHEHFSIALGVKNACNLKTSLPGTGTLVGIESRAIGFSMLRVSTVFLFSHLIQYNKRPSSSVVPSPFHAPTWASWVSAFTRLRRITLRGR